MSLKIQNVNPYERSSIYMEICTQYSKKFSKKEEKLLRIEIKKLAEETKIS